ncbi:MAG: hypothetical protein AAB726_02445 [Patescibacteria group bacterium]
MKLLSNKNIFFILFILVFSAIFLPGSVFASSVYIDTSHSDFFVGDTIVFSILVDSENKNINAVEGGVLLNNLTESASLVDINTSGSALSLWPGKPLPSDSNASISFAGGSPSGLNSKNAIIFNIVLKLKKEGQITLTPDNLSVYLNDGKGTKDSTTVENLVVNVLPSKSNSQTIDDLGDLISNDKTPPEPFEIYLGQEGSVFDGKKFLSFSTTDSQSGINYYEVIEGGLSPVRSSGTYVLQEQNKSVKVTIVAYDSAGNARKSTYGSEPYNLSYLDLAIIIFVLMILVFVVYKIRRKRKKT